MRSHSPVAASQMRTVLSSLALASRPSRSSTSAATECVCPSSVRSHSPVAASQMRTVSSSLALASRPSRSSTSLLT